MDVKWLTLYDIYPYTFNHVNSIEPYLLYTANKHRVIYIGNLAGHEKKFVIAISSLYSCSLYSNFAVCLFSDFR